MRRRLEAARPDVIVMLSNDHLLNWPHQQRAASTRSASPTSTSARPTGSTSGSAWSKYRVPGHPELARFIVQRGRAPAAVRCAYLREMEFDDGISVPTHYLNPDAPLPARPRHDELHGAAHPDPGRAPTRWARVCARCIRAYPGPERVAVSPPAGSRTSPAARATSGWTRSSTAGSSTCSSAATTRALLRECTLERMEEAGSGGTAELLAWIAVLCRSPRGRPTCSPTCRPSPGARAPAWSSGTSWPRRGPPQSGPS